MAATAAAKWQRGEELLEAAREAARAKGEKAVKALEEGMAFRRWQAAFAEAFRQQQ
jgi:hypothetical protein